MQIFDGKQIPQRMVDGWNAFFFDKTEELVISSQFLCCGMFTDTCQDLHNLIILLGFGIYILDKYRYVTLLFFFLPQKKRLPSLGKNTETLGELWLGLLRFYTEEFDFKEYVISIRQKKLLTTFEKQWTSKCIAIEGNHSADINLGTKQSKIRQRQNFKNLFLIKQ